MTGRVLVLVLMLLAVCAGAFAGNTPYSKIDVYVTPRLAGRTCGSGLPAFAPGLAALQIP